MGLHLRPQQAYKSQLLSRILPEKADLHHGFSDVVSDGGSFVLVVKWRVVFRGLGDYCCGIYTYKIQGLGLWCAVWAYDDAMLAY